MAQTIKLTEAELKSFINETVEKILNEECDEGLFGDIRNKFGAAKDTFMKGGNYQAHLANRELQGARQDTETLKNKYGVQNGMNGKQYVAQNSANAVAQINAKYDQKIQQLEAQRQQEIAKATGKFQKKWDKYQGKKQNLDTHRNQAYNNRRTAMNQNPYADFAE